MTTRSSRGRSRCRWRAATRSSRLPPRYAAPSRSLPRAAGMDARPGLRAHAFQRHGACVRGGDRACRTTGRCSSCASACSKSRSGDRAAAAVTSCSVLRRLSLYTCCCSFFFSSRCSGTLAVVRLPCMSATIQAGLVVVCITFTSHSILYMFLHRFRAHADARTVQRLERRGTATTLYSSALPPRRSWRGECRDSECAGPR